MNTKEILLAIAEGKKVRSRNWQPHEWVRLEGDWLVDQGGQKYELCDLFWDVDIELYKEPNPHPKGTFAWAREEAKRGRDVRRGTWSSGEYAIAFEISSFSLADIDATDWEVVS